MLYIKQFQHNRQDYIKHYQHFHLSIHEDFSLSSNQYNEKFPNISRPAKPNVSYSRNQTLFFLSRIPSLDMKSTTEHQQKTGNKDSMTTLHRSSITDYNKKISNENSEKLSTFTRHQAYSNVYRLAQSTTIGNQLSNSIPTESDRSTTAPLILEKNIYPTPSENIKITMSSRSPTPLRNARLVDSSDDYNNTRNSLYYQLKSTTFKSDNHFMQQPSHINTNVHINETINTNSQNSFLDLPADTNSHGTTTVNNDDEPQILYRNNQQKINGFQHIANLGSWQRRSKSRQLELSEKSKEKEDEEQILKDIDQSLLNSSTTTYKYKRPFSEEYDQAIYLHAHYQTNNSINEWNLKDFYRDVKTSFEPETNAKPIFEKCLKLARLQANTIKWEQRRRQNLIIYNRLIKSGTFDNNILNSNGIFSSKTTNEKDIRDINELKRELRCNECKRLACLGNCAPGNEYRQYKRFTQLSSLLNTREQSRSRLNLRTQRSTTDLRPCTTQQTTREIKFKLEQTNTNPIVVVPVFENESQTKRSQKKLTHRYLPNKSLRSQRRETLTAISTPKISS
ncbi:unnamed protein product [Rotaria sp. Silwood2]|nr:unnamed protein product [Rotaria sp. Silwood2]